MSSRFGGTPTATSVTPPQLVSPTVTQITSPVPISPMSTNNAQALRDKINPPMRRVHHSSRRQRKTTSRPHFDASNIDESRIRAESAFRQSGPDAPYTVDQLKQIADYRGISYPKRVTKQELVDLLQPRSRSVPRQGRARSIPRRNNV